LIAVLGLSCFNSHSAYASWQFSGANSLVYEFYDVDGEADRGLYADEGSQLYNDFYLNFSNSYSPYKNLRGYIQTSVSNSDYRQTRGTKVNAFSLNYETGEQAVPYRVEFGDFFASQSQRTIQRGLKGIQVELQPVNLVVPQSIQLFWGRTANDYSDFFDDASDAFYTGASWLAEYQTIGSFAFTSVNYRDNSVSDDTNEWVNSLAWQNVFTLGAFDSSFEMEVAYLSGSRDETNLDEHSRFFEVTGYSETHQDFLISYQRNSERFSPQGSAVAANRESIDLQWGQQLFNGMSVRLRGQKYIDSLEDSNPRSNKIYGVTLIGLPFKNLALNTNLDISMREQKDEDRSYDNDTFAMNLNLAMPINEQIRGRASFLWQQTENNLTRDNAYRRVTTLGIDVSKAWFGWQTSLSPSLNYIEDLGENNQDNRQLSAGIVINAQRNSHSFLVSHQQTYFDPSGSQTDDFDVAQTRIQWQSQWQQHRIQLNADWYAHTQTTTTDSYKASIVWTYQFEKETEQPLVLNEATSFSAITTFNNLADLTLNRVYDDNLGVVLADAGWSKAGSVGLHQLYEGRFFSDIAVRQVLALETRAHVLKTADVMFMIEQTQAQAVERLYQQLLDKLLKVYGNPTREFSRGAFTQNWRASLNDNELIRIVEWQTDNGILRFGLPRPKTGQLRFELQLRPFERSLESNDWAASVVL
jgi:hypothetical protein